MNAKELRDKRRKLSEELASLRSRVAEKESAAREAFGKAESFDGKAVEAPEFAQAESLIKDTLPIKETISEREREERAVLHMLGDAQEDNTTLDGNGQVVHTGIRDGRRFLADSQMYQEARNAGIFNSSARFGTLQLGELADRDSAMPFLRSQPQAAALPVAAPGQVGTPTGVVMPDFRGLVQPNLMSLSLLDLIPTGTTDSNSINYVQVTAIPDAGPVAELALKPEQGLGTVDATAPVRTIAGFIKAARQALDDVAFMGTLINQLLPYAVRFRLIAQLLQGDGTGQNLTGLYNTTGVGDNAHVAGDTAPDTILKAITSIVLSDADPNFVALNPVDWQNLMLLKDSQGRYIFGAPGTLPSGQVSERIWGLNVISSRAVPAGRPLVGDASSATLLVREGVNIKTSDSDQDDFVRNRITVLAECRVAFVVWRPTAFAIAELV